MSRKRNHQPRIYQDRSRYKAGPSYLLQGLLISNGYVVPNHDTAAPTTHGFINQLLSKSMGRLKSKLRM